MSDQSDGLGGTDGTRPDNVESLFKDRPSAAGATGLTPDEVIATLETMLELARNRQLVGLSAIVFDAQFQARTTIVGKCPFLQTLGAMDNFAFELKANNLAERLKRGETT